MCSMSRLAWGLSQHTKSAPLSISAEMKATLRLSRSSFAITSVAFFLRHSLQGHEELRTVRMLLAALNLPVLGNELAGSYVAKYGGADLAKKRLQSLNRSVPAGQC